MTRKTKIELETKIEAYIILFITKRQYFDYWLDSFLFMDVARTLNCSIHKVKKIFFKKMMLNPNFKEWLQNFEY